MQVGETKKRILGAEHPSLLTSMANLASAYQNQGQWKEAEELKVQVMETRKRVLGAEHPDTLTGMWMACRVIRSIVKHLTEGFRVRSQSLTKATDIILRLARVRDYWEYNQSCWCRSEFALVA